MDSPAKHLENLATLLPQVTQISHKHRALQILPEHYPIVGKHLLAAIKEVLAQHSLKMPQLAMPVRVLAVGTAHTPSVDAVLELLSREILLAKSATAFNARISINAFFVLI